MMPIRCLVLACLLLLPSLAWPDHGALRNDTFNTVPDSNTATFRATSQTMWEHEQAQREGRYLAPFIHTGGLHGTSASLTSPAFATEAFVPERVNQTATAITYAAIANDVCWVILSSDTDGITGWTRVGVTAYYYQCEGDTTPNEPLLPPNSAPLMRIETSGSAITTVIDLRKLPSVTGVPVEKYASFITAVNAWTGGPPVTLTLGSRKQVTANVTIPKNVTLVVEHGGLLDIPLGITVTQKGAISAGDYQIVAGAGSWIFQSPSTYNVLWRGCVGDDLTDNAACLNAVGADTLAAGGNVNVHIPCGTYRIVATTVLWQADNMDYGGGGYCTAFRSYVTTAIPMIKISNNVGSRIGIKFHDMRLEGGGAMQALTTGVESALLQTDFTLDGVYSRLYVNNSAGIGILFGRPQNVRLEHSEIRRSNGWGIVKNQAYGSNGQTLIIKNNTIKNNGFNIAGTGGIYLEFGDEDIIEGNQIEAHDATTPSYGLLVRVNRARVVLNAWEGNRTADIQLGNGTTSAGHVVQGNSMSNGSSVGGLIVTSDVSQSVVAFNQMRVNAAFNVTADVANKGNLFIGNIGPAFDKITSAGTDGKNVFVHHVTGETTVGRNVFADGSTTPFMFGQTHGITQNTAPTTITDFEHTHPGQLFTVRFLDNFTTLAIGGANGGIVPLTGANMTFKSGDIATFVSEAGTGTTAAPTARMIGFRSSAGERYRLECAAALNFDLSAVTYHDLTIPCTGAKVNDPVLLGVPVASVTADTSYSTWVSAADVITVRARAGGNPNPASGTFTAIVHTK